MFTGMLNGGFALIFCLLGFFLSGRKNKVVGSFSVALMTVVGIGIGLWNYIPLMFYYGSILFAFISFSVGYFGGGLDLNSDDLPDNFKVFLIIAVVFSLVNMSSWTIFRATAVGNIISPKEVDETFLLQIDPDKIRLVPKRSAEALSKGSLSKGKKGMNGINLGSVTNLDQKHATIQKVKGSMYWIEPLEYNGWKQQTQLGDIPGYVAASAYDTNVEAPFINKSPVTGKDINIRATLNGNFGRFAKRSMWEAYPFSFLHDFSFEVDDEWTPYIVATILTPAVGIGHLVPRGVVVMNVTTLEIKDYDMDNIPVWIDRVQPLDVTLEMISNYGNYRLGIIDSFFGDPARFKPTDYTDSKGSDLFFVESGDGKTTYWVTGLTSMSDKDNSLVGLMFQNTRTGEYFQMSSSGVDENGVDEAVTSMLGNDSIKWQPTQPIPYNVMGIKTWIVPIVSIDKGYWQGVALVHMDNVNNRVWSNNLKDALRKYLKKVNGTNIVDTTSVEKVYEGIVDIFNLVSIDGSVNAFFSLEGQFKVFECSADTIAECLVLPRNKKLKITVKDTGEKRLYVTGIDGFALDGNSDRVKVVEPQVSTSNLVDDMVDFDALSPADKAAALKALKDKE